MPFEYQNCSNCRFGLQYIADSGEENRSCRRYPAQFVRIKEEDRCLFPIACGWCGEWRSEENVFIPPP